MASVQIRPSRLKLCIFAIGLLLSSATVASASLASGIYEKMLTKIRSLHSYQVTVDDQTTLQPSAPGAKSRTIRSTDEIAYQRPNLFSLKNDGLMGGISVTSDGKNEYFYSSLSDEYAKRPSPSDIVGSVMSGFQGKGAVWSTVRSAVVDGVRCKELSGTITGQRGVTKVTLCIRAADYLPYKVSLTLPTVSGATGNSLRITRTEVFNDEKLNAPIDVALFQFSPPDGAQQVNSPSDLASSLNDGQGG